MSTPDGVAPRAGVSPSTRREAIIVVITWVAACLYTCGYAILQGYGSDRPLQLIGGIPAWIVWGIGLPWFVCLAVTIWMSFWGIRDEDLGIELEGEGSAHG